MKIGQFFYSLQGEGSTAGVPAFFIRFAGCNLNCGMDGTGDWVCDSIAQWTKAVDITVEQLWKEMETSSGLDSESLVAALIGGDIHIVYTGGEPLLPANRAYMNEINTFLRSKGVITYRAEIETNGTIDPAGDLDLIFYGGVDVQINCSPKLASSGLAREKRINVEALASLMMYARRRSGARMFLKFVVAKESDVQEVRELTQEIAECAMTSLKAVRRMIILMSAGETREKIVTMSPIVWNWCALYQYTFSSRLHILAFDRRIDI